jgi:hypothetical protein
MNKIITEPKYIVLYTPGYGREIVDEFPTRKEALKMLAEYNMTPGNYSVRTHSQLKGTKTGRELIQEWNQ